MSRLEKLLLLRVITGLLALPPFSIKQYQTLFCHLMNSDSKFTLPVIRSKSETPKIIQKYLLRLRLDGLLGRYQQKNDVIILITYFVEHFDVRGSEIKAASEKPAVTR